MTRVARLVAATLAIVLALFPSDGTVQDRVRDAGARGPVGTFSPRAMGGMWDMRMSRPMSGHAH